MAAAACLLSLAGSVGDLGSARLAGPGGEAGDECPLLLATCLELLRNDSHRVKMLTADAVKMFFGVDDRTGHYRLTAAEQEQLFVKLCEHLRESLDDVGDYKGVEKRDQLASRVYALVTSLANVATSSPYCEKKAVLALCQVVTDYGVNLDDVREVLLDVAAALGYPSLKRYMQTHLGFLISAWLDEGQKLDSLPYALFECGTLEEFYRQNYQQLVPHLVIHDSFDAVRTLALHVCGGGAVDPALTLLVECFPAVFVHVLPLFAAGGAGGLDDGDPDAEVKVKRAIVAYHKFEEAVTKPVMNQLLTDRLDEVVVCLLMLLDPGSPASSMPHALNPPAFNAYTIKTTLDYLTTYCKAGKTQSCLVMLLTTQQDNIQKVLLALSVAMARAYTLLEQRRVLLMYRLFVRLLVRYLSSGLGGAWAFTLRDVVHTVCRHVGDLRLQAEESGGGRGVEASLKQEMFAIHCEILEYVFAEALKCCPEVVTHVAVVTATLVPVVKLSSGAASEKARSLLEMLFVQNASKLADVMASLHPFPDTPDFARLRAVHRKYKYADGVLSLREEIEIFLKASEASAPHSRGEGLQHIGEQLSSRRLELEVLVRECKRNGQQSILVRLICELIAVCRAAGGEEERQAAARCLGSIGVADLFTLVLQARGALQGGRYEPRLLPGSTDSCDHLFYRNATIFHQLSTYLTDSSVEVVTAASSVLKHLLATKSGQDFAALYKDATNDHLFQNLHPFRKRTRVASARIIVPHEATFLATMDIQEVWAPTNSTHADWITNLVCYLIKSTAVTDEMLLLLEPICKAKVEFCELVLPYLVHSILARRCDVHRDVLSRQVRGFFSSHCGAAAPAGGSRPTTPAFTGAASDVPVTMNKHSVRVMLNLLQYLRLQQTQTTCGLAATAWDTNFWLDVDYLQLARAAQYCSAYFTSVLFTEIACYIAADMCASELPLPPPKRAGKATMTQQEVSEISQTFFVSRLDSVGAHAAGAHAVLLEAYRAIGDSDCVYGCVVGRLADPATRITTYEMENKWERALGTYDLLTHQQPAEGSTGIVKALQRAGLDHVLHSYLEQLRAENRMEDDAGLQSVFYGSAWRDLGQWNLDTTHRSQSAEFQQTIYSALQQVADGNEASAAMSLAAGREAVIGQLLHAGLETTRNIYPALSSLQCLNELEQALPVICRAELVGDLLQRWQHSDVYSVADYDFVEPVLSLRCAVLSVLARRRGAANVDLQGALMTSLERLSRLAREAGLLQIAEKNIFRIKQLEQKWQTGELSWNLEEAKIYWARAECDTALCLLKSLVCDLKKATANGSVRRNASLYPKALCLYGDWLASTHSKHPQVIMEDYLEKAVECVERGGAQAAAVALDAYLSLARYADNQYRHVVDYMCSSTYDAKQALLRESREAASMIKTMDRNQNADTEVVEESPVTDETVPRVSSRVLITLEKQSILDQREMSDMLRQKNTFLVKAVNNYLRLLRAGDDHDLRVFRLVSLWFHNANNDDVNALIKDGVGCIKSHKFLALMYQLAARMSTKQQHSSLFQPTLDELIVRTVKDHPHHTLPIILALANSYKDTELFASKTTPGRGRRSKVKENSVVEEDRVLAAKNMLNLLRVRGHGDIIANMEALSDAYISLAYLDASAHKKETQSINIPASQHLLALANLHNVAVPTLELPVDPTCEYKNIVHVVRFAPTFKLAGGLNLPKIITCLSSDGKQRRQLVKARDDLRQDAVMQQVFAIVNRLLQGQQETRKRRLHIRQYKVMPLSQRSGLLEWCEDTIPLGVYLVGDSQRGGGAHHKYRPGDWTASACRRAMLAASGSDKLAAFLDACRHFLPVFRHFFFEGFVEPAIWFERKLAYTRSVATNSIVGYILGLGDRHVQNILVDRNTAELVHIDLGIAFEQGRILPTPETVPFRLTRDIVDGMGVTGTEGVFRRCCEKTMEVMRSSQEAIVTILEVLLHDPLYAWNLTPLKACAVQQRKHDESAIAAATTANTDLLDVETAATAAGKAGHGSDADVNKMAERVLLRLRQKLQGVEDGVPLSIEGQVSHLIQEARDPKNLACLFPGWQPYL